MITYTLSLVPVEEREKSVMNWPRMRTDLSNFPEIVEYTVSTSESMGAFGANTVDVEIYGYNISETNVVAEELAEKIRKIEGAKDVTISRDKSKPELQIILDQDKMISNGLEYRHRINCNKEQGGRTDCNPVPSVGR